MLAGPYRSLFGRIDLLIFLAAPGWDVVHGWRLEQEEALRQSGAPGDAIMTTADISRFISHFARPATLTIRLFANIMAEELVIVIFFGLFPILVPLPFMAFAIFGGLLQAFIFCTLTMVYLGGAVATEEHH